MTTHSQCSACGACIFVLTLSCMFNTNITEWQPIRQFESDNQRLYRSFNFGQLVHLSMIDTRYNEREQQVCSTHLKCQLPSLAVALAHTCTYLCSSTTHRTTSYSLHATNRWKPLKTIGSSSACTTTCCQCCIAACMYAVTCTLAISFPDKRC
jgi:PhoD-like phosphatase